jgi:hypothetical protein
MRRLLIVTPHFPPTDAVDMHRVRMNVRHYASHGWEPTILAVRPRDTGRLIDDRLLRTVPTGLDIREVGAISETLTSPFGLSAVGIRALLSLRAAGDTLLSDRRFDLVFFSTTAFPVMSLGPAWKRRHGVPYVLDFQDPWATAPAGTIAFIRGGLKHRLMRWIHGSFERTALPEAAGVMAVSPDYIRALKAAFPVLKDRPNAVIPFGFSKADFDIARAIGKPHPSVSAAPDASTFCYAGRIGIDMVKSVEMLFRVLRRGIDLDILPFSRAKLVFLGTSYQLHKQSGLATAMSEAVGLDAIVSESSARIPLLDSMASLMASDILMVLGSDDGSYQPSKLYQCMALGKPIICFAPSTSLLGRAVEGHSSVLLIPTDIPPTDEDLRRWGAWFGARREDGHRETGPADQFEAASLAALECSLFDEAVEGGLR